MTKSELVAIAAFTNVHEALLAKSVLESAGIDATIADEHVVSMAWMYSNAVGGVKVLVPEDRAEEAASLLNSGVSIVDRTPPKKTADHWDDMCPSCGSTEFESRLPGKGFAVLSWLLLGAPLGSPFRRRYCKRCGARVAHP